MNTEKHLPFFVYGTLRPDQPNAFLWRSAALTVTAAVLHDACLFDMGHYPILIEETGRLTHGNLVTIAPDQYDSVLKRLDWLERYNPARPEEGAFRRRTREVIVGEGERVAAWVYVGEQSAAHGCPPVPGNDWARYSARRQIDMADWWRQNRDTYGRT